MGILNRIRVAASVLRSGGNYSVLQELVGQQQDVDPRALAKPTLQWARRLPAYRCAVDVLSSELALLPIVVAKRWGADQAEFVDDAEARRMACAWTSSESQVAAVRRFFCNVFEYGAGFIHVVRASSGVMMELRVLDPRYVERYWMDGDIHYVVSLAGEQSRTLMQDDVVEVLWRPASDSVPYFEGDQQCDNWQVPYVEGWQAIRSALLSLIFTNNHFGSGGLPAAVLETAADTPMAAKREAADVRSAIRSSGIRGSRILAVSKGSAIKMLGMDPEKSLLADMRRLGVEEISRLMNIPPQQLYELTRATYNNVEQADRHLSKHSLAPWALLLGQELTRTVYGHRPSHRVALDLDGSIVGDLRSRADSYGRLVQMGIFTQNEARARFGLPAMADGDILFPPAGVGASGAAGGDDEPDVLPDAADADEEMAAMIASGRRKMLQMGAGHEA